MSDKDLYCSKLWSKISDATMLKMKYKQDLETSKNDFDFKRDYEIYRDIKSDLKYKHLLYQKDCVGFGSYLISLMKN